MKTLSKIYMALVLMFLYVPIFVLIVFSFNETKSRSVFSGFTLDWYIKLFRNEVIISSLMNTIIIAVIASIAATVLGTLAAIGINSMRKVPKAVVMNITNMPIVNPEIVTGVSLMLLFVFFAARMNIALKEASETEYWLELLYESDYIEASSFDSIYSDCQELIKILVAITKHASK